MVLFYFLLVFVLVFIDLFCFCFYVVYGFLLVCFNLVFCLFWFYSFVVVLLLLTKLLLSRMCSFHSLCFTLFSLSEGHCTSWCVMQPSARSPGV